MLNELGVIGLVQYTLPLLILVLFGVVQTIPRYLEAAEIHGARRATIFMRVVLPARGARLIGGGLLAFNMSMGAFTSPVALGGGHVLTMPVLIQQKVIQDSDYAMGAALATGAAGAGVRRQHRDRVFGRAAARRAQEAG